MRPGDEVKFESVELEKVYSLHRQHMERLEDLRRKIRERDMMPRVLMEILCYVGREPSPGHLRRLAE